MEMMDLEEEEADDYAGDSDDEEVYFDQELPMDEHFAIRHFGMMSRSEQREIYNNYASVRCAIEVQRIKERAQLRRQGAIDDEDDQECPTAEVINGLLTKGDKNIASCPANRIGHTHRSGRYPGIAGSAHSFVLCLNTRFHIGGMDHHYSYRHCERSL